MLNITKSPAASDVVMFLDPKSMLSNSILADTFCQKAYSAPTPISQPPGKHDADSASIRWCFADASLAAAFASRFGTKAAVEWLVDNYGRTAD